MANLYPYIYSDDAKTQAEFYANAIGGEIILSKTFAELPQTAPHADERLRDKILHLRLRAAGQVFFMSDSVREPVQRGNGLDLTLEFADENEARQAFEGLSAGGELLMPFARQFWAACPAWSSTHSACAGRSPSNSRPSSTTWEPQGSLFLSCPSPTAAVR